MNDVLLINFSHPLTAAQLRQVTDLVGVPVQEHRIQAVVADGQSVAAAARALVAVLPVPPDDWQQRPVLVSLPGLASLAACLLAELHGRTGYFPSVVVIRPAPGPVGGLFEVSELVNLQQLRMQARLERSGPAADAAG